MPQYLTPFVRLLLASAMFLISSWTGVAARHVDDAAYLYPYSDPYLATTTIAIMKGRDEGGEDETIRSLQITVLPGRENIPLLEGKGKLRFRLYPRQGKAPLIIIVPGLGSSAYAGSASYIAESLFASGFHVMVMPDPLNWNFALAASTSGFPGDHFADAADMYRAMQLALRHVIKEQKVKVDRVGLMGFSEGALCSAFVDKLDSEQGSLNFATTLLVNPPVDPLTAIEKIDDMAKVGATLTPAERSHVMAFAFGTAIRALKGDFHDPDYFDKWDQRLKMSKKQIQFLIGAALFSDVGDTMYVIELAKRPNVLKTPISEDSRTARLDEARSIGLMGYLQRFLLPRLRQDDPHMDLKTLHATTSLKAVGPALAKSRRVYLMHNRDDILLSPGDIEYLQRTFGERAMIYPRGGHLGNLWYPSNQQDILTHFLKVFGPKQRLEDLF